MEISSLRPALIPEQQQSSRVTHTTTAALELVEPFLSRREVAAIQQLPSRAAALVEASVQLVMLRRAQRDASPGELIEQLQRQEQRTRHPTQAPPHGSAAAAAAATDPLREAWRQRCVEIAQQQRQQQSSHSRSPRLGGSCCRSDATASVTPLCGSTSNPHTASLRGGELQPQGVHEQENEKATAGDGLVRAHRSAPAPSKAPGGGGDANVVRLMEITFSDAPLPPPPTNAARPVSSSSSSGSSGNSDSGCPNVYRRLLLPSGGDNDDGDECDGGGTGGHSTTVRSDRDVDVDVPRGASLLQLPPSRGRGGVGVGAGGGGDAPPGLAAAQRDHRCGTSASPALPRPVRPRKALSRKQQAVLLAELDARRVERCRVGECAAPKERHRDMSPSQSNARRRLASRMRPRKNGGETRIPASGEQRLHQRRREGKPREESAVPTLGQQRRRRPTPHPPRPPPSSRSGAATATAAEAATTTAAPRRSHLSHSRADAQRRLQCHYQGELAHQALMRQKVERALGRGPATRLSSAHVK